VAIHGREPGRDSPPRQQALLDLHVRASQVHSSLLEAADRVVAYCEQHGLLSRDLDSLRDSVARLKANQPVQRTGASRSLRLRYDRPWRLASVVTFAFGGISPAVDEAQPLWRAQDRVRSTSAPERTRARFLQTDRSPLSQTPWSGFGAPSATSAFFGTVRVVLHLLFGAVLIWAGQQDFKHRHR